MSFCFLVSCQNAIGEDIWELTGIEDNVSSHSFIYKIAHENGFQEEVLDILGYIDWGEDTDQSAKKLFKDDFALSCHKSYYQGIPCYYVQHSRIEYIFIEQENFKFHLDEVEALARHKKIDEIVSDFEEFSRYVATTEIPLKSVIGKYFSNIKSNLIKHRIPAQSIIYRVNERELLKQARSWDSKNYCIFSD